MCQSHTGHMTGLWFLPTRPLRLNTNEWIYIYIYIYLFIYLYISSIENEEAFNDGNIYAKVPFLKSMVKCVTITYLLHDTCTCTEEHNVDLVLYGRISQLSAVGFYVRRIWRYYSPLCRVLFLVSAGCWRHRSSARKNGRRVTTRNRWLFAQSPCCTSFRSTAINVKSIIAEVVVKGRPSPWSCLQIGNLKA